MTRVVDETNELDEQLLNERSQIRASLGRVALGSVILGLLLFGVLEVLANSQAVLSLPGLSGEATSESWQFDAGISDADSVVIVTALVLLVATLNVALAALLIKNRESVRNSVSAFTWAGALTAIGGCAGSISLALAVSRFGSSPPLGVVLIGISALTIALTGSITLREDSQQAKLALADLRRTFGKISKAIDGFGPRDSNSRKPEGAVKAARRDAIFSLGIFLVLVLSNSVLVVGVMFDRIWETDMTGASTFGSKVIAASPLFIAVLVVVASFYVFFWALRTLDVYFGARGWKKSARLSRLVFFLLAVALPVAQIQPAGSAKEWETLARSLSLLLLPQLVIWLWSVSGSKLSPKRRYFLQAFVYVWLVESECTLKRRIAANEKSLDSLTLPKPTGQTRQLWTVSLGRRVSK